MDVLALRKTSGKIEGEVRLNGHLQDPKSFRRCTGYVEQVSHVLRALYAVNEEQATPLTPRSLTWLDSGVT